MTLSLSSQYMFLLTADKQFSLTIEKNRKNVRRIALFQNKSYLFSPNEKRSGDRRISGEELWSAPLEARPGAVVATESALGEQGSSFWVMDLDGSGALHLSHWEPAV